MSILQVGSSEEQDKKHQETLEDTGFWGKAGAGSLVLAVRTKRILFALRSKHVQEPLTWGTWGGAIDEGEDPKYAARRELQEEAGYRGHILELLPLWVFRDVETGFKYFNFLAAVEDEFTPRLDWENSGYKWVEAGKWPTPLHPGAKLLLRNSEKDILDVVNEL